jgi:hypothetical protein
MMSMSERKIPSLMPKIEEIDYSKLQPFEVEDWSNDKVFDHLLPAFRTYALLSAEERICWIRQARRINYSRADQILTRLADLLAYPPRERMPCLLLFGATEWAKLTSLRNSCAIIVPVWTS